MTISKFFKRKIIPVRQRPISADLNELQEQMLESTRLAITGAHCTAGLTSVSGSADNRSGYNVPHAFQGGSFLVRPDPAATPFGIMLQPGFGYSAFSPGSVTNYDSANGLDYDGTNSWAPLVLSTYQTGFTVPAPPASGSCRIDIIEVKASYLANNPQTVGIFNTATEVFDPATRNKDFTWDLLGRTGNVTAPANSTAPISYKTGVAAVGDIAVPSVPSTTTGYVKIAQINVIGGATAVATANIIDFRKPLLANGVLHIAGKATIPGIAAGLGTAALTSLDLPPGIAVKMAFYSNSAPSAGVSYTARFYVFGAITPLFSTSNGAITVTAAGAVARCPVSTVAVSTISLADVDILNGTDTTWTVVNGTHEFPYGQPCAKIDVTLLHPAGSALSNSEDFFFNYTLSMA